MQLDFKGVAGPYNMFNYRLRCCSYNGCFGRRHQDYLLYNKTYSCFNQTTGFSFELQINKSMDLETRQTLRDMINLFFVRQERKH